MQNFYLRWIIGWTLGGSLGGLLASVLVVSVIVLFGADVVEGEILWLAVGITGFATLMILIGVPQSFAMHWVGEAQEVKPFVSDHLSGRQGMNKVAAGVIVIGMVMVSYAMAVVIVFQASTATTSHLVSVDREKRLKAQIEQLERLEMPELQKMLEKMRRTLD